MQDYKYFAFISYQSADSGEVEFVFNKLRSFRYSIFKEAKGKIPDISFLRKIFWDRCELPSKEEFSPAIQKAIRESKYLIVFCSKNSAKSKWVDNEVDYFYRTHDENETLVIPYILENGSFEEVCPPSLLKINAKNGMDGENGAIFKGTVPNYARGGSLPQSDRRNMALFTLLSCLLGVDVNFIKYCDNKQKMKLLWSLMAVVAVILTLVSGLAVWALYAEHQAKNKEKQANDTVVFLFNLFGKINANEYGSGRGILISDIVSHLPELVDDSMHPTVKANVFNLAAKIDCGTGDYAAAKLYAEKAEQIYDKKDPLLAHAYLTLADVGLHNGDFEKMDFYAEKAAATAVGNESLYRVHARALEYKYIRCCILKQYDDALKCVDGAEKIYGEKNGVESFSVHLMRGAIFMNMRDFPRALEQTRRALELLSSGGTASRASGIGSCHMLMSKIRFCMGEIKLAAEHAEAAVKAFSEALGDENFSTISALISLAKCRAELGDVLAASEIMNRVKLVVEEKYSSNFILNSRMCAMLARLSNNPDERINLALNALAWVEKTGDKSKRITECKAEISMFLARTLLLKGSASDSLPYFRRAFNDTAAVGARCSLDDKCAYADALSRSGAIDAGIKTLESELGGSKNTREISAVDGARLAGEISRLYSIKGDTVKADQYRALCSQYSAAK